MKQLYTIFFTIYFIRVFSQPVNDEPCGALPLVVNVSCTSTSETTGAATVSTGVPSPSCGTAGKDTWYSFVAPSAGTTTIKSTEGSFPDGVMAVYSGASCSSLTEIACNDNFGASSMPAMMLSGLIPGDTYYIRFWKKGTGTGTFNICLFDASAVATYTNNDCAGALQICSTSSFAANSGGDGIDADLSPSNRGCLVSEEHQSAWYYWQIATSGTLTFTINPDIPSDDYDFGIWGPTSLCPAADPTRCSYSAVDGTTGLNTTSTDVSEDASGDAWVKFLNVTAGSFYIICVDNFLSSSHGFTFSFGGTATINCDPVVLPVVLNSFTATAEQDVNVIQWSTSSEHNSDYFAVEKSSDGVHFTEAGRINAAGTSTTELRYTFTDNAPFNGDTYYRLNQVDANASSLQSNIISVYNAMAASVNIYPNPSTGIINVTVNTPEKGNSTIEIFTAYGQPVYKTLIDGAGQQTKSVTLPSKGIFWVVVQSGNERYIEKISY